MEHENFRKYHLVTIRRNLRRRRIFHRQYRIIYHNHRYSLRAPDSQTRYIGIMALRKRDRTPRIAPRMPFYPDEHHLVFYRRNLDFPIAHFLGSPVLLVKSTLLALVGAIVADRSQRVSLLHVAAVVVAYQVLGGIAEWLIASDLSAALQDFKIGFPGMLLQVVLGWVILKGLAKYEC